MSGNRPVHVPLPVLGLLCVQNSRDGVDARLIFAEDGAMGGEVGQCS